MAIEIERKFLVHHDRLPALSSGQRIQQAYIPTTNGTTVRVRLAGDTAYLGLKTRTENFSRNEYEFPIPVSDANEMLDKVCGTARIEKMRYLVTFGGNTWEVDIFEGLNAGLIVAEIELSSEAQQFERPEWIADEVTSDPRFSNFRLATIPFSYWS